jgi:WD40 repeat protein
VKAHFTVLPGSPTLVRADPSDTTLYVGGTETLRPFIVDAYGNRRPDTPVYQYHSLNAVLTMNSLGKATAATFGRGLVAVSALGFTDTVRASVVPTGRIATQTTGAPYVIMMNLDGSSQDSVLIDLPPRSLDWSSVNHMFVMDRGGGPDFIYAMDTTGHLRRVDTNSLMRSEWYPRYSPDGSYMYFTGNDSVSTCYGVWRMHQDGTALGRVVADTLDCGPYAAQGGPSPEYASSVSPDGTQLVYASRTLRVRTLATGVDTSLGVVGYVPRWSPTGEWIAYDSLGTLMLIHPDGTGHQALADRRDDQYPSDLFTWSPDGQWLLYHTSDRIVLVQVTTGLQLPLAVTIGLFDPVWQ